MLLKGENVHGADVYSNRVILDFSSNVSPLGTPRCVKKAVTDAAKKIYQYPDPYCRRLVEKISEYEKVSGSYIICGNGAADIIFALAVAVKPKRALIVTPTFCEYENSLKAIDCHIEYFRLKQETNFDITSDILEEIKKGYDIVYICNPNNPTGKLYKKITMLDIANLCKETNTRMFIDECFMDLTGQAEQASLVDEIKNNSSIFILKAFTKSFGMAGVRLGYGITSDEKLLEAISSVSQVWNVSTIAQEAGCAALSHIGILNKIQDIIKPERKYLQEELVALGFKVYDSSANFLLFQGEKDLYQKMLKKGIMLRRCYNFDGLDDSFYRCAVKSHNDNIKLITTLKRRDK